MHQLHATAAPGVFAADLVGYTAGLFMTLLLLVLTVRALRLPGASAVNVIFALCALAWSGGGLAYAALVATGGENAFHLARFAEVVQFFGAAAFPIAVLGAWRPFAGSERQRHVLRILRVAACISAAAIAAALIYAVDMESPHGLVHAEHLTSFNATLLMGLGAAVSLRPSSTPRAVFIPSLVIIAAVAGAAVLLPIAIHGAIQTGFAAALPAIGNHLLLLVVLCSFFLFARFRYADIFIRYSARVLLAAACAMALALGERWLFSRIASGTPFTPAFHVFGITILAASLILAFAFADAPIANLASRLLFRSPNYRAELRRITEISRGMDVESDIAAVFANGLRQSMELEAVRVAGIEDVAQTHLPAALGEGEIAELASSDPLRKALPIPNVEFLVPIYSAGQVTHVMLVAPGPNRPALVSDDLHHLRAVAAQYGNRLDALRRERENLERRTREALLLQQITEAELRALRSQINPHFLFNSLNTIADLIVKNPARAEEMTLRLADVFRHVLAHSSRSFTTVRDEIEFLRTYLSIEEVRFRDRLQVHIDVAPDAAAEQIPSLILQPVVENAIKHGLAPKPGPGHLWVWARFQAGLLRLQVEDDGMGIAGAWNRSASRSNGLGLSNIAERLKTLYQDRASLQISPRAGGGTSVVLLIPRTDSGQPQ